MMSLYLKGWEQALRILPQFEEKTAQRIKSKSLSSAGARMRTYMRRAAPEQTGTMKKSIKTWKNKQTKEQMVGLADRFYYKTLEFGRKAHTRSPPNFVGPKLKGKRRMRREGPQTVKVKATGPLRPWFFRAYDAHKNEVAQVLIDEIKKNIYIEAGKIYAQNRNASKEKL
jgi:hypothetical protein